MKVILVGDDAQAMDEWARERFSVIRSKKLKTVSDARRLKEEASYKGYSFLVNVNEGCTESAFEVLLKAVEESQCDFVFKVKSEFLLPATLRSRCELHQIERKSYQTEYQLPEKLDLRGIIKLARTGEPKEIVDAVERASKFKGLWRVEKARRLLRKGVRGDLILLNLLVMYYGL